MTTRPPALRGAVPISVGRLLVPTARRAEQEAKAIAVRLALESRLDAIAAMRPQVSLAGLKA